MAGPWNSPWYHKDDEPGRRKVSDKQLAKNWEKVTGKKETSGTGTNYLDRMTAALRRQYGDPQEDPKSDKKES